MNNGLYVNFEGLESNIEELKNWKTEFDELNSRINAKIEEMNNVWQGEDYNAMRTNVELELKKITGPDGMIQNFVNNRIKDIEGKKGNYTAIQDSNANYWG